MNSRQKIVQQRFLNDEAAIIRSLNRSYTDALNGIKKAIEGHYADIQKITDQIADIDPNDPQVAILRSMRQSKVYQKRYQEQLERQVSGILRNMNKDNYLTVSSYLEGCYDNGFIGAMYDLHGQGIPLTLPINQQRMAHAVQLESKISQGLYTRMGQDVAKLKQRITAQVSRSMVSGDSFAKCADYLRNQTGIGLNNAVRIARTEGHRIQTTAAMDALTDAKDNGCDVVKQWDAALDGNVRESHAMCDGEIRELDEPFSNGLQYPGDPSGDASEVVNCRCALLERARWALDQNELDKLQERAEYYGLDKSESFEDFKERYLGAVDNPLNNYDYELIDPRYITPVNDITDSAKYEALAYMFEEAGYNGRPILVVDNGYDDYRALTGSHRIYAAREAGIDIPSKVIDADDLSGEDLDELMGANDDDERYNIIRRLRRDGEVDDEVFDLISSELDSNAEEFGTDKYNKIIAASKGSKKAERKVDAEVDEGKYAGFAGTHEQVDEYLEYKDYIISKYGEENMWSEMTDEEIEKLDRLERIAYRGK